MDVQQSRHYIDSMATVLTPREQQETASIAWQLGGYDDMFRLERELRAIKAAGKRPKMVIDQATGKKKLVEA
ncbi:hypothetical protein [Sphingomonas sp. PB1R3]|uniref:hypothetical protein n=1 Tax=Sphingomonas flavida TaxID=3096154 RepID=UPI002FCABE7C